MSHRQAYERCTNNVTVTVTASQNEHKVGKYYCPEEGSSVLTNQSQVESLLMAKTESAWSLYGEHKRVGEVIHPLKLHSALNIRGRCWFRVQDERVKRQKKKTIDIQWGVYLEHWGMKSVYHMLPFFEMSSVCGSMRPPPVKEAATTLLTYDINYK